MTLFILILFAVIGGCLIAYAIRIFHYLALPRFLNEFWGRLRQSHGFTILQLLGTRGFWEGVGFLSAGVVAGVIGWAFFRDPADDVSLSSLVEIIFFLLACVVTWSFMKRYSKKVKPHLPRLPADQPTIKLTSTDPDLMKEFKIFEEGFQAVYTCLHRNLQAPFGKIKTWFAIPGSKYPAAYLWDTCFISGAWRLWDARIAQEILRPFLDLQNGAGMCPQNIALGLFPAFSITNPPLLAFAFVNAARMTGDFSIPIQYISRLQAFERYLEDHRQSRGLFQWIHSYESGLDNSPRFTDVSEKQKRDLRSSWAVDLNVWMILFYQAMAEIIRHNSQNPEDSTVLQYDQKISSLLTRMLENLWDSPQGLFFDLDYGTNQKVAVNTIASLLPLALDLLPVNVVDRLVKHVEDPAEYNTLIPLPTVARNDPLFAKDTWRGPVWINTAWMVLVGLCRHDNKALAADLAYRIVKGVYEIHANCGSFYEFYDPDSPTLSQLNRKKGNLWKRITLGNQPIHNFCGWTALINTIFMENIIGYQRKDGVGSINPTFPKHWRAVIINVKIPQFNEEFDISISNTGKVAIRQNTLGKDR